MVDIEPSLAVETTAIIEASTTATTEAAETATTTEASGRRGPFEVIELVDKFDTPTGDRRVLWYSIDEQHAIRLLCHGPGTPDDSPARIEGFITTEFVAGGRYDRIPVFIQVDGIEKWIWSGGESAGNHAIWLTDAVARMEGATKSPLPRNLERVYVSVQNYDDDLFLMKFETAADDWAWAQGQVC